MVTELSDCNQRTQQQGLKRQAESATRVSKKPTGVSEEHCQGLKSLVEEAIASSWPIMEEADRINTLIWHLWYLSLPESNGAQLMLPVRSAPGSTESGRERRTVDLEGQMENIQQHR